MNESTQRIGFHQGSDRDYYAPTPTHPRAWVRRSSAPSSYLRHSGVISLPSIPSAILDAITLSQNLLALRPDWDDAGAEAIDASTLKRATDLLRRMVLKAGAEAVLPVPRISPCNDGSIDLFWKTAAFTLLINVQPKEVATSDFYGETASGLILKGTFTHSTHDLGVVLQSMLKDAV